MSGENILSLISVLQNNKIDCMAVGLGTFQQICVDFGPSLLDVTTNTIDFKRSAAAHFAGMDLFLNINIVGFEFKFGIRNEGKVSWSIPVKLDVTPKELEKIIKLKNYW